MNKLTTFSSAALLSVMVAGSVVSPALAWHPKGMITKSVQNITAGGEAKPADNTAGALAAKPGDILQYTIEVSNIAAPAEKQYNDLAFGKITDTLPAGVELVSDPSVRTITADMPTVLPGNSFTKQFQVRVVETTDGKIVENKACYTADSVVKDNAQKGCDVAIVKVAVPVITPTPTPIPTPTPVTPAVTTPTPPAGVGGGELVEPETLPSVGAGSTALFAGLGSSVFGYIAYALNLKRRASIVA